ncbi:MAG TPA: hypothetical protein VMT68_15905 [Caulobacteraceae bacterium]|nr:hypothetical protein [Caulobacteraceae bacterium]
MRGVLVSVAVLALAACAKPATNAANEAANTATNSAAATPEATPAAAAPATAGAIALTDLPAPTAGAWTRVSTQDGGAPDTSTKCLDGKPIDPAEGMPSKCASMTAQRTATGGFVVNGDCPNNGIDAKLTLAGEGDFKKSFITDSTMVMSGGPGGDMTTKNHSVYTYAGPTCSK